MHNPVDWYPWGSEALERARAEDKPLLVSIGYSACHWCHVMERESFEDPETAALMNRLFVSIKVDREERPDVDQIYMDSVVRLQGQGGWPLTVFCTPDSRPYYGGTYFPPEPRHGMPAFRQVLEAAERAYRTQPAEVEETARRLLALLGQRPQGVASELPGAKGLAQAARELLDHADTNHGGFGAAPKFPTPTNLDLLLSAADVLPAADARRALEHVVLSCRAMARGGVYDQLGGGFHRYSVDAEWCVPHFEKMLYDQGQLLRTYAETWRRTGARDDELCWPVRETAAYLAREMSAKDGGFYASQDADSEGEEGRFYVFSAAEVREALGDADAESFCRAYDVSERGNFEGGRSVLRGVTDAPRDEFAAQRASLLAARAARVAPDTDRKRVAAWNGLAISGLARAGGVLGDPALIDAAAAAFDFAHSRMLDAHGRLQRIFDEAGARVPAFLDDLACMLEAALDLYRARAEDRYLEAAVELASDIALRFFDADEGDLFLTPVDAEPLVHRPRSDHDGATPHSTGLATQGLVRCAALSGREDLRRVADRVLRTHAYPLERAPAAYPTLLRAAWFAERGISVAVVVGKPQAPETQALAQRARRVLPPEVGVVVIAPGAAPPPLLDPAWVVGRDAVDGRATAYVCRGTECSLPVTDPDSLVPLDAPAAP
jgi:uncharacterized protein YyaL (SSP411 family)